MVKHLIFCGLLAMPLYWGGSAAVPAVLADDLYVSHPSHYSRHNSGGSANRSGFARKTKQAKAGSRLLLRDEGRLVEKWMLSAELSKACNRRVFRQKRENFLIAEVDGRTYGAAVGGHASLVDRGQMAEKQVIYLFRGQGTTDCRVYHRTK